MRTLSAAKQRKILAIISQQGSPCYIFDPAELSASIRNFRSAFRRFLPGCKTFFAIKANPYPGILKRVIRHGFGIEVSSKHELSIAVKRGAKEILYNSPGKTGQDLTYAVKNCRRVTVNIDSFRELEKLGIVAQNLKKIIRAGIRIHMPHEGNWSKFGIPLRDLKTFWQSAKHFPHVRLEGIHFHTSQNRNEQKYTIAIRELARYLHKNFSQNQRAEIRFIDIGGGFFTNNTEGRYRERNGSLLPQYDLIRAPSVKTYAKNIGRIVKQYLKPLVSCRYYIEPGRILCNSAMAIALQIVEVKKTGQATLDGGTNMVGWGYNRNFYMPSLNLTHPAAHEIPCVLHGCLCTPKDIWGYHCHASIMQEGDVIFFPNQGAYKYSLAQNFIHAIPPVHTM